MSADAVDRISGLEAATRRLVRFSRTGAFAFTGMPMSITATSLVAAQELSLVTYSDSTSADRWYELDFSCPAATSPAPPDKLHFVLFENGVPKGEIATVGVAGGSAITVPVHGARVLDGINAPTKWSVRAWVDGGTGLVYCDVGVGGGYSWSLLRSKSIPKSGSPEF